MIKKIIGILFVMVLLFACDQPTEPETSNKRFGDSSRDVFAGDRKLLPIGSDDDPTVDNSLPTTNENSNGSLPQVGL